MDSVASAPIPSSGLYCFGDNSEGNLGTGETTSSQQSSYPLPIELSVPIRFVSVASGLFHSLALTGTPNHITRVLCYVFHFECWVLCAHTCLQSALLPPLTLHASSLSLHDTS